MLVKELKKCRGDLSDTVKRNKVLEYENEMILAQLQDVKSRMEEMADYESLKAQLERLNSEIESVKSESEQRTRYMETIQQLSTDCESYKVYYSIYVII